MHNDNASAAGPDKSRRAFLILVPLGMLGTAGRPYRQPAASEKDCRRTDRRLGHFDGRTFRLRPSGEEQSGAFRCLSTRRL